MPSHVAALPRATLAVIFLIVRGATLTRVPVLLDVATLDEGARGTSTRCRLRHTLIGPSWSGRCVAVLLAASAEGARATASSRTSSAP